MRNVLKYAAPYKRQLFFVFMLYFIQTVCSLLLPYIMSNIVNEGVAKGNTSYIWLQSGIMLGVTAFALVCSIITARISAKVSAKYATDLQKAVFRKTNTLTFEEFGSIGSGSLLTRSTEDVFNIMWMCGQILFAVATFPVMFFGGVILSFGCDPFLSGILLLTAPIIILIVRLVSRKLGYLWKTSDEYCDLQNKVVRERLSGLRVIRAFDKETVEHERVSKATRTMAKNIIKANVRASTVNPLSILLLDIATVVMLYVASKRIQTEALLTAGDVVAVIQYVTLIMNGIMVISWTFISLPHLKVCVKRISEVLSMKGIPEGDDSGERLKGDLKLNHVTFKYEGSEAPVLSDINMDIKAGEIVSIIGGTGCGKSTLSKLLLHFYDPTEGSIVFGGKDYRELSKETARSNISIALQKGTIFGATVGENIRMGNKDASLEQMTEAMSIAQMSDFLASHKEGFDYELQQSGSNISGGQKQRINIARTIVKDASVYIFDDSFSALDYLTESKLRRELNSKLKGKTQIIITQRAATAMRSDKIYVFDRGRIVGAGTHAELLDCCRVYKEIYDSQLGNMRSDKLSSTDTKAVEEKEAI